MGYLYEAGRLVIEGYTYATGYDYLDLGFDFGDYAHTGFYSNLNIFTSKYFFILFILIFLYFFIFKYKSGKFEIKIEYFLVYVWKKFIQKEQDITPLGVFFKTARRVHKNKIKSKNNFFSKYLILSYFILIFSTIGFYTLLLFILKFYDQGQNFSKADVLKQNHYIVYKDEKMFRVICGKTQCIYSNKSYDYFKKIKEENYDIKSLEAIKQFSSENEGFTFYNLSTKIINPLEKIIYIQIQSSNKSNIIRKLNPFNFYLYVISADPKKNNLPIEKTCYHHFQDSFTLKINKLEIKDDNTIPYFVAFKVPKDSNINFIEVVGPRSRSNNSNSIPCN
ncbi:hypothetical protein [Acinetobacter pittii]|uniref:hypothetical protein n=1 Tax=Acinetobacter pittii TaxID=48296 RepID=UPI00129885AC|nr:hypothetical protein [Acinetobacter pittii]MRA47329.1 hypothetical protein [Acinetobacter pittii]